jgi:hypothetical protein
LTTAGLFLKLSTQRSQTADALYLLCFVGCNFHIDLLIVCCIADRKVSSDAAGTQTILKLLQRSIGGSLIAAKTGIAIGFMACVVTTSGSLFGCSICVDY